VKVLVLGGTRFIGLAAARALVGAGHEVICFHRGQTAADLPEGATEVLGERAELARHRDALAALAPDAALDMIAMTAADSRPVAEVLASLVPRVAVASSCDVYRSYGVLNRKPEDGEPFAEPAEEDGPLRISRYPYRGLEDSLPPEKLAFLRDYDKLLVEDAYREVDGLEVATLRLPMVYGPGDPQTRTAGYLRRMLLGRDVLLPQSLASWRGCRGYVDDAGAALALVATHPDAIGGTYAVAEPSAQTELEWVRAIGAACGWQGEVVVVPDEELPEELRPGFDARQDLTLVSPRIRALGFAEALARPEAIARTVAWQREALGEASRAEQEALAREAEVLAKR